MGRAFPFISLNAFSVAKMQLKNKEANVILVQQTHHAAINNLIIDTGLYYLMLRNILFHLGPLSQLIKINDALPTI